VPGENNFPNSFEVQYDAFYQHVPGVENFVYLFFVFFCILPVFFINFYQIFVYR